MKKADAPPKMAKYRGLAKEDWHRKLGIFILPIFSDWTNVFIGTWLSYAEEENLLTCTSSWLVDKTLAMSTMVPLKFSDIILLLLRTVFLNSIVFIFHLTLLALINMGWTLLSYWIHLTLLIKESKRVKFEWQLYEK